MLRSVTPGSVCTSVSEFFKCASCVTSGHFHLRPKQDAASLYDINRSAPDKNPVSYRSPLSEELSFASSVMRVYHSLRLNFVSGVPLLCEAKNYQY